MNLKLMALIPVAGFWAGVWNQDGFIHPVGFWVAHGMAVLIFVVGVVTDKRAAERGTRR